MRAAPESSLLVRRRTGLGLRWRALVWQRPDWWFAPAAAAAWVLLLTGALGHDLGGAAPALRSNHEGAIAGPWADRLASGPAAASAGSDVQAGPHAPARLEGHAPAHALTDALARAQARGARSADVGAPSPSPPGFAARAPSWALMVLAMMLPLAGPRARWLAHRSLTRGRRRAVLACAGGFIGVWLAAGVPVTLAAQHLDLAGADVAAGLLALAAVWHCAPARRRALLLCGAGRAPRVRGWRAGWDCAQAGARSGARCVATCGLPMAAMTMWHSPLLMAALWSISRSERRHGPNPHARAGRPPEAVGLAALAGVLLLAELAGVS